MIQEFKKYRRKSVSEMRQVVFGEDLIGVLIFEPDKKLMQENPNVFAQGYVARNPKNHEDLWYVAKEYFDDNLEPIEELTGSMTKPGFEEKRLALFIDQAARECANITHSRPLDEEERYYKDYQKYDGFVAGARWMMEQLNKQQDGSK
jgi:hypothetical protein